MSLKSKVSIARPGSTSLRATIPEGIVAFLNLEEGDDLEWIMEIFENERVAVAKKMLSDEQAKAIALKHAKLEKRKGGKG
jgi:bifunctional DNA-binding transcriptional regulator/antitoxin component of YhaV-PrlF toxin-antitoxin module